MPLLRPQARSLFTDRGGMFPEVVRLMRYEPDEPTLVVCPVCGTEAGKLYRNYNGEVVGCEDCIEAVYAEDYLSEIRETQEIEKGCHWNE